MVEINVADDDIVLIVLNVVDCSVDDNEINEDDEGGGAPV